MKNLKKILVALAIGALMCGALTGCADAVPEDAALRDLMEKTEVETQEPDVEKPDDLDSETDSEADKPTESESDKDSDKDSGSENSGSSNSGNTASKPSGSGNSGNSKPSGGSGSSGGSGNSGGNSQPAHKHEYSGSVTKNATCNSAGVKTYKCNCGASYTESIPALGHDWQTKSETVQVWQEGATHTYSTCSCGKLFNSVAELEDHQMVAALNGDQSHSSVGATHKQDEGKYVNQTKTYKACNRCGARQ